MRRDYRASLEDIEYCLDRIRSLTRGLEFEEFTQNLMKQEAILRNLEIIWDILTNKIPKFDVQTRLMVQKESTGH